MEENQHTTCDTSRRKILKKAYVAPTLIALGSMTLTTSLNAGSSSLQNNGWGNGDQKAPGNSLYKNRAENNRWKFSHRIHGPSRHN